VFTVGKLSPVPFILPSKRQSLPSRHYPKNVGEFQDDERDKTKKCSDERARHDATVLRGPADSYKSQENSNMQIGEPQRVTFVEPLELPVPKPERIEPDPEPTSLPEHEPAPEKVPVR